jgi:hypothetical protein
LFEGWEAHKRIAAGSNQSKDLVAANYFLGYVTGFAEATPFFRHGLCEIPKDATMLQLLDIVGKYLEAHPEQRDWHANISLLAAFQEAFPDSRSWEIIKEKHE